MSHRHLAIAPGLCLRPWSADDLPALLRHADDPHVVRGLSQRFPSPYTRADGEAFLRGDVVDLEHALAVQWQGEACGGIGLRPGEGERAVGAEFGYWLGRAHWGQGIMRRVVGAYVPWVMGRHDLQRLQATVLAFNVASARVLQANGFNEEGVLRRAVRKAGVLHDLRLFARLA